MKTPRIFSHVRAVLRCLAMAVVLALALPAPAQVSPLLSLQTIQVNVGEPVQFTFSDVGTGSTNYAVEFTPALGGASGWMNVPEAIITPAGGGEYQVMVGQPESRVGFYRVRGLGGMVGMVTASFSLATVDAEEGGMTAATVVFNGPYYGVVRYTISGTVEPGDYVALSGEVMVSGTVATIPITLRDNEQIGQLKYLTLRLEAGPDYALGATSQSTINILENDADWQGSFVTEDATVGFVLRLQESNGVRRASVRSEGRGLFPAGETLAAITLNGDFFSAVAPNIALPVSATLLEAELLLTLSLRAANGLPNQSVTPTQIEGEATLVSEVVGKPYLNTTNAGTFLLLKPPVAPSTNQVELVTIP